MPQPNKCASTPPPLGSAFLSSRSLVAEADTTEDVFIPLKFYRFIISKKKKKLRYEVKILVMVPNKGRGVSSHPLILNSRLVCQGPRDKKLFLKNWKKMLQMASLDSMIMDFFFKFSFFYLNVLRACSFTLGKKWESFIGEGGRG